MIGAYIKKRPQKAPLLLIRGDSVKVSTGPAQRKKGAQKHPCKQTVLQGQGVFTQS